MKFRIRNPSNDVFTWKKQNWMPLHGCQTKQSEYNSYASLGRKIFSPEIEIPHSLRTWQPRLDLIWSQWPHTGRIRNNRTTFIIVAVKFWESKQKIGMSCNAIKLRIDFYWGFVSIHTLSCQLHCKCSDILESSYIITS